ncbi:MAG: type I glyceraldehyde-3-phosphate dehydrogenase, partial [Parcubacteria group bacterium]
YTNDQRVQDLPHSDMRRARAAALSMIPTSTGAARAIGLVIPELKGKLDGFAMRVPVANVSVVDLTCSLKKDTTAEEVNKIFKAMAEGKMKGILDYTDEDVVSVDFNHSSASATVDSKMTKVIGGNFAKVIAWYDNEWGYSCRVVDLIEYIIKRGL